MGAWTTGPNVNAARQPRGCGTLSAALIAGGSTAVEKSDGTAWENAASLLVTRSIHACFGTQLSAVVCGGSSVDTKYSSEKWDNTSWAAGPNMNVARQLVAATGTQTAGLVTGGYNDVAPANEASTEKFDGTAFTNSVAMPAAKVYHAMAGVQTSALAFGGSPNAGGAVSNLTYSWNNTAWSTGGNLNTARCYLGGAGLSNTSAIAFGGSTSTTTPTPVGTTETYNSSLWATQTALNTARQGHGGLGTASGAFAVTGRDASVSIASTEKYGNIMAVPTLALNLTAQVPAVRIRINIPELVLSLTGYAPAIKTGKYIQVPTLELTLTGVVPFVKIPTVIAVPTMLLSLSTQPPNVIPALIFLSTRFPSGKTVSYKIVDKNNTVIKDWTVADMEVVVDATAAVSVYGATTPQIGDAFQGWCFWKTNDAMPRIQIETFNAYDTYIYGARGDISGIRFDMTTVLNVVNLLNKYIRNKKTIVKDGSGVKYLVIYDNNGTTELVRKSLKDSSGFDVADLTAGILALENASSV